MTIEFNLPDIGEGLDEAEVIEWHVKPGDVVERDQPFVDILTDKAQTEMPAPGAGTVVSLGAEVGDMVKVGELLIVIDDGADGVVDTPSPAADPAAIAPASAAPGGAVEPESRPVGHAEPPPERPPVGVASSGRQGPAGARRPKASPSTRRLAVEQGVDLQQVSGTGPGGRILAADVEAAVRPVAVVRPAFRPPLEHRVTGPAPGAATPSLGQMEPGIHPLRGIRRATAKAMDRSWSTIPHVTAMDEIDAGELMLARNRAREALGADGQVVTPLSLLMVAVARTLRRYPMMNATLDLDEERISVHDHINVGVAVASDRGLMVPVVHDADRLGVAAMAAEIAALSAAARDGSIDGAALQGGTFTVTNYGSNGGYFASPIIRPGESGIVGFGAITTRPFVVEERVEARPVLPIVVAADHRLIDGDVLSAFQSDLSATIGRAITLLVG